jgi:hypothetical protein
MDREFAAAVDALSEQWKRTSVLMDLACDISDLIATFGLEPTSEIA